MLSHPSGIKYLVGARVHRVVVGVRIMSPVTDSTSVSMHVYIHRTTLSANHQTVSGYPSPASVGGARQSIRAVGPLQVFRTGGSRLDLPLSSGGETYAATPTVYYKSILLPPILRNYNHNILTALEDDENEDPFPEDDDEGEEQRERMLEVEEEENSSDPMDYSYDEDEWKQQNRL